MVYQPLAQNVVVHRRKGRDNAIKQEDETEGKEQGER